MDKSAIKTLVSAIVMMLCLGSIYAWSIYVPYLVSVHGFTTGQTQVVFGGFIGVFTITMVLLRNVVFKYGIKASAIIGALLYSLGYLITFIFGINFTSLFIGITIFSGVGTGIGYLISISIPVEWFPKKRGLVTGLVSAGFGGGAVIESFISGFLLEQELSINDIFLLVGLSKGVILLIAASQIKPAPDRVEPQSLIPIKQLVNDKRFLRLFLGIFTGTFAGLIVIGNLKPIGLQYPIDFSVLVLGITVFSVANFMGRVAWGWINDYVNGALLINISLFIMGCFTLFIGIIPLGAGLYLFFTFFIGFGFGANFVLYVNETVKLYGSSRLGSVYPFIFLGYGISGMIGPFIGGALKDLTGSYQLTSITASALCFFVFALLAIKSKQKLYN